MYSLFVAILLSLNFMYC